MLNAISRLANAHPRRLAAAVGILFIVAVALGASASNDLNARNDFANPGSPSAHARERIERATGAAPDAGVVALVTGGEREAASVARALRGDSFIARVSPPVRSRDGSSAVVAATLRAGAEERAAGESLKSQFEDRHDVALGGPVIAQREVGAQASADLGMAEALAFPLLALLAFFIFRGIASLLPIAVGATSVFTAFAVLRAVNVALPLSVFALNLVIGLGLGLAVDYSLFMVSRFREELGAGRSVAEAVRVTMRSAGRTITYSAVTVAVAMSSLTVFPLRFLQSMGIGGAIVAVIAAGVALTLLPALFVLFGARLGRVVPPAPREGRWYALAQWVLRRPGRVAALTAGALILLTVPALRTHWSGVDARVLPASASAHRVESALEREYPTIPAAPAYVALQAPAGDGPAVQAYARELGALPGVQSVSPARYLGSSTWQIQAVTTGEAIAQPAQSAVAAMRAVSSPFDPEVGGSGAEFADQRSAIADSLPVALAILVVGTLIVLWLMTGSVVLPVKALAMNALTVGAATGLLVLIFQDGRLTGPLDYAPQRGISQSNYLVLAAIAFALSTDYGVFLLTRIKEARDNGADNRESIALGLQRTGRIVTAAAVLLAVAIGAFATSNVIFLKEIGVGAVFAVLIDAFIVRTLLVPALMGLLGPWNWWSPAPLRRLHRRIGLSEDDAQAPSLPAGSAGSAAAG